MTTKVTTGPLVTGSIRVPDELVEDAEREFDLFFRAFSELHDLVTYSKVTVSGRSRPEVGP